MQNNQDNAQGFKRLFSELNVNTILILIMYASLYLLSGIFVTKETYYRDQVRIEATLQRTNDKLDRLIDITSSKLKER